MDKKVEIFKGSLDGLANDVRIDNTPSENLAHANPKRGRPKTSTREITKSSQEGTKEGETRATFIMREDLLEKLKALAYWDRQQIKSVISEALETYLNTKGERYMQIALSEFKKVK